MPIPVANALRHLVVDFIWCGKPSKVKYETLIGAVGEGGLGLLDPLLRMKALRVKTVKLFLLGDRTGWRVSMAYFLSQICGRGFSALWMQVKDNMTVGIPEFYREVLRAWASFREALVVNPVGRAAVLHQPLFLNPVLELGWGPKWKVWFEAGFRTVGDLFYVVWPGLLPFQAFVDDLTGIRADYRSDTIQQDLDTLLSALPAEWREAIDGADGPGGDTVDIVFKDGRGVFGLSTLKHFYIIFRDLVFVEPVANSYWSRVFQDVSKTDVWGTLRPSLKCPLLDNFDFLLRHNCISNEMRLFKMGFTDSDVCKVCGKERDGLKHVFFYCEELGCFTQKLVVGFGEAEDFVRNNWEKVFLFGAFVRRRKSRQALQLFLAVARHAVWMRRVQVWQSHRPLDVCLLYEAKMRRLLGLLFSYFGERGELGLFDALFVCDNPFVQWSSDGVVLSLPRCS